MDSGGHRPAGFLRIYGKCTHKADKSGVDVIASLSANVLDGTAKEPIWVERRSKIHFVRALFSIPRAPSDRYCPPWKGSVPGGASGLQIRVGLQAGPWWVRLPLSSAEAFFAADRRLRRSDRPAQTAKDPGMRPDGGGLYLRVTARTGGATSECHPAFRSGAWNNVPEVRHSAKRYSSPISSRPPAFSGRATSASGLRGRHNPLITGPFDC